jgi:gamma-glutamylcyclotransferase (GGCT)/AIG2-like uncharacterized protein YtfP
MDPELLFVYGTLMRGFGLHRVLAGGATFVGEGRVAGCLLDLGAYPGLVEGEGTVRGEVYRLDQPALLPALDREEGREYERRRTIASLADGRHVSAWVYHYRGSRARGALVPGGDYRQARPARSTRQE